ncbi:MAG: hypothetical protein QXP70_03320 [Methanomassiliicoccales archaeon]
MIENKSEMAAAALSCISSGGFSVSLNNSPIARVRINGVEAEILLYDSSVVSKIAPLVPDSLKKFNFLRELSSSLDKRGLSLKILDEKGELLSAGHGVHSLLGKQKVKLMRLRRLLK